MKTVLSPITIEENLKANNALLEAGIDYSLGRSNFDPKTGIHFGVISQNEILQAWGDSSEAHYNYTCPYCGADLKKGADAKRCPSCYKKIDPDRDFDMMEPSSFFVDDGEYLAESSFDDPDIFVIKSPFFTRCMYCSPCAPGAGYLMSPKELGVKSYCFGHDWFEAGKAPYPVYRVDTGEEVT